MTHQRNSACTCTSRCVSREAVPLSVRFRPRSHPGSILTATRGLDHFCIHVKPSSCMGPAAPLAIVRRESRAIVASFSGVFSSRPCRVLAVRTDGASHSQAVIAVWGPAIHAEAAVNQNYSLFDRNTIFAQDLDQNTSIRTRPVTRHTRPLTLAPALSDPNLTTITRRLFAQGQRTTVRTSPHRQGADSGPRGWRSRRYVLLRLVAFVGGPRWLLWGSCFSDCNSLFLDSKSNPLTHTHTHARAAAGASRPHAPTPTQRNTTPPARTTQQPHHHSEPCRSSSC